MNMNTQPRSSCWSTRPQPTKIKVNRTKISRKPMQTTTTKSPQERQGVKSIIVTAGASLRHHTTTNNSIATAHHSEESCHHKGATTKKRNKSDEEGPRIMVSKRSWCCVSCRHQVRATKQSTYMFGKQWAASTAAVAIVDVACIVTNGYQPWMNTSTKPCWQNSLASDT